ncbi:MAG TPA: hypothetical protein VG389_05270 [Myxococcota bacterium]|jgi:hypothetical protein|nr:hypothetical protein [Myxococcota bacterium]
MLSALLVLAAGAAGAAVAPAEGAVVKNTAQGFQVFVPAGFEPTPHPMPYGEGGRTMGGVAMWHQTPNRYLIVMRRDADTAALLRKSTAAFDELERGVSSTVTNYEAIHRNVTTLGKVLAVDLWFKHGAPDAKLIMGMRFLVFEGHALYMGIDVPADGFVARKAEMEKVVESFVPWTPPKPK